MCTMIAHSGEDPGPRKEWPGVVLSFARPTPPTTIRTIHRSSTRSICERDAPRSCAREAPVLRPGFQGPQML